MTLARRALAEGVGTAFLLAAVVGSGIMGERLADGNVAIALLANTLATAATLVALILTFGPLSGAHFNPLVTVLSRLMASISTTTLAAYVGAQIIGAVSGVAMAHMMFGEPLFTWSQHARSGSAQVFAESVATFGLLVVIGLSRQKELLSTALTVGAFIAGAYWFTSSTSFANPAVTLARAATDTFAGIRPADVPGFLMGQLIGAAAAAIVLRVWLPRT